MTAVKAAVKEGFVDGFLSVLRQRYVANIVALLNSIRPNARQ